MQKNSIKALLFGSAVGDALGVPYEFCLKGTFKCNDMVGNGTHNQDIGTWSDDTSMTLCLADQIAEGFDLYLLACKFVSWLRTGMYTANKKVFDIGYTCSEAIRNFELEKNPKTCGLNGEYNNGNGSLMRIAPLVFYIEDFSIEKRFEITKDVSSLTHSHELSVSCCFLYLELLRDVLNGLSKNELKFSFINHINDLYKFVSSSTVKRIKNYIKLKKNKSSGFVLDTLKSSLICFLTTDCYKDSVIKAVNLGEDSDTTACVTGALAGLYYGFDSIPNKWIKELKNNELIFSICDKLKSKINK